METTNPDGHITRRGFLELSSAALAGAGLIGNVYPAKSAHSPEDGGQREVRRCAPGRIAEMDRGGLDICILSLTAPGVQAVPNITQAIAQARRTNDYLAENIAKNPKRSKGFATLPLQDPQVAGQELTRCVRDLGFCGALVNGFSQIGEADSAVFYDLPQYRPFWATVQELDVPFYLHPRFPLASRQQSYEGSHVQGERYSESEAADEPLSAREFLYHDSSGNFRTQALTNVILEVGANRILYSVDYPYEDVVEAKEWYDQAAISDSDRVKIARSNAQKLFRL